ncbi:MAG TPA: hypothetical protein VD905_20005 [Flavobacteriales bacterium]|nr:hypothetical protein [Flavobacteriales bacterium]
MKKYKNTSCNSGILAYETGRDFILVQFTDGEKYRYSYKIPGKKHVDEMKKLAAAGKGLATYINKYVRERFEGKQG